MNEDEKLMNKIKRLYPLFYLKVINETHKQDSAIWRHCNFTKQLYVVTMGELIYYSKILPDNPSKRRYNIFIRGLCRYIKDNPDIIKFVIL